MVYRGRLSETLHSRDLSRRTGMAKSSHLPHSMVYTAGDGAIISMLASTTGYLKARWSHVQLGPDSLPPQLFIQPDGFFDIRITGAGVDVIYDFTLRLDTANLLSTAIDDATKHDVLLPMLSTYFFDRVEVQPDGGSTEDTQYADQNTILLWHLLTTEQKSTLGFVVGMNASGSQQTIRGTPSATATCDEDAISMRAGEKKSFYIPHYSMLTQAKIFLPGKKQNPRIRYYCAYQPVCTDSGQDIVDKDTFGVIGANGIISGILFDECVRMKMIDHYKNCTALSRVLVNERQILDIKSAVTAQQLNDLSLTVFNGEYSMFWVYLMRGEAVKEQLYDSSRTAATLTNEYDPSKRFWIPIARISFTDSSGNPVWYNFVPGDFVKHVASAQNFPGTYVYQEKNLYPFVFCTDAPKTLATGGNTGGMYLDSNFQLQLVPGNFAAGATTSYSLRVNALRYALLSRNISGKFEVTKL